MKRLIKKANTNDKILDAIRLLDKARLERCVNSQLDSWVDDNIILENPEDSLDAGDKVEKFYESFDFDFIDYLLSYTDLEGEIDEKDVTKETYRLVYEYIDSVMGEKIHKAIEKAIKNLDINDNDPGDILGSDFI